MIPISHIQPEFTTHAQLLIFAQRVAELMPVFHLNSRIIFPTVRCLYTEDESLHVIELARF
jgi:hypothetical protein